MKGEGSETAAGVSGSPGVSPRKRCSVEESCDKPE